LQGKTQLFPTYESDYFRNRLTHSLEVAQIAKSIAIRLNHTNEFLKKNHFEIDADLCEIAGLAHDLGHPPFGHNGEAALDRLMWQSGGFEGNAQTLRILCRLEKKERIKDLQTGIGLDGHDERLGLNLAYRSLASILKYDRQIPQRAIRPRAKPTKGYYVSEAPVVRQIKQKVAPGYVGRKFRTIECSIMELADDIAYSTYDLEDALKAGFTSPLNMISTSQNVLERIRKKLGNRLSTKEISDRIFDFFGSTVTPELDERDLEIGSDIVPELITTAHRASEVFSSDGFLRNRHTSDLVGFLINKVELKPNPEFPSLTTVYFPETIKDAVDVLKQLAFVTIIESPMLKVAEFRGKDIVDKIYKAIKKSTSKIDKSLLPDDFRSLYLEVNRLDRDRVICDFIAGMTDRYALEFYGRIYSERPQTIFKPL